MNRHLVFSLFAVITIFSMMSVVLADTNTQLQYYYPAANTYAETIKSGAMNGNNIYFVNGYDGTALSAVQFNGVNSYANSSVVLSNLSGASLRTIAFWAKTNISSIPQAFISTGVNTDSQMFSVEISGGKYLFNGFGTGDWDTGITATNGWNFHTITYNGTHLFWYLNGTLINSTTRTLNTLNGPILFGQRVYGSNYLNGSLQRISLYNRTLSSADVTELFTAGGVPVLSNTSTYTVTARNAWTGSTLTTYTVNITKSNPQNITNIAFENTSGLVARYYLDEYNGSVLDSSGNGRDGAYQQTDSYNGNITFGSGSIRTVPGVFGNALNFTGDAYVRTINLPFVNTNTSFTMSMWVRVVPPQSGASNLISNTPTSLRGLGIQFSTTGTPSFMMRDSTGSSSTVASTISMPNIMTHLSITYNNNTQNASMYINGSFVASAIGRNISGMNTFRIGGNSVISGTAVHFNGTIDEVRLWLDELSQSQIAQEMVSRYPVRSDKLVMSYSFEANSTVGQSNITFDSNRLINGSILGGKALNTTQYFNTTVIPSTPTTTFSWWSKISSLPPISYAVASGGTSYANFFLYAIRSDGRLAYSRYNNSVTCDYVPAGNVVDVGNWTMYTVIANPSNASFYKNGVFLSTVTCANAPWHPNNFPDIEYGSRFDDATQWMNGSLDGIYWYNRSLSQEEISNLFSASRGRYNYANGANFTNSSDLNLYNVTVNSTSNGGFFQAVYNSYNFSALGSIVSLLYQAQVSFNASELITNVLLPGTTSITTVSLPTGGIYNLSAGNYTVTFSASGFNATTVLIEVLPFMNTTYTFANMSSGYLSPVLRDYFTNGLMTNYTLNVNNTLYNYSVSYSTTNGSLVVPINNKLLYNIFVSSNQNGGYLPLSYLNTNASLAAINMSQTNITFYFLNTITNTLVTSPIQFNATQYGYAFNTSTGAITFNPQAGVRTFSFYSPSYSSYYVGNYSYTFAPLEVANYTIAVYSAINISFIDEFTNGPFNLTRPQLNNVLLYTQCPTSTYYLNVTSNNPILFPNCDWTKITAYVAYSGVTPYTRSILPINITGVGANMSIYLIDLITTTSVTNDFYIDDLFAQYNNPRLAIFKTIGNQTVQIHGDYFDVEQKVASILIQGNEYSFLIYSDNLPANVLGQYVADVAGSKSMRVYSVGLTSTSLNYYSNASFGQRLVNISGSTYYVANYTDTSNLTSSAVFSLYANGSSVANNGTLLMSVPITASSFYIAQNITPFNTSELWASYTVVYNGASSTATYPIYTPPVNRRPPIFDQIPQLAINFAIIFFVGIVAVYATSRSSDMMALFISGITFVLSLMGWFAFGNAAYWGTYATATSVTGIFFFLALINLFRSSADRSGGF